MRSEIIDDKREIKSIVLNALVYEVGTSIKKIIAYEENGEMAKVVWFAIYHSDNEINVRVNGKYVVAVNYREEGK